MFHLGKVGIDLVSVGSSLSKVVTLPHVPLTYKLHQAFNMAVTSTPNRVRHLGNEILKFVSVVDPTRTEIDPAHDDTG